jgi:predicted nuclease of predicted toxin-antitoxin system
MIWLDAHLSPSLALWIEDNFNIPCRSARYLGLRDAKDVDIFRQAKEANAIVMTKDKDFIELLYKYKAPPKVIWLTCGNTSKEKVKELMLLYLSDALQILNSGDDLVEIQ